MEAGLIGYRNHSARILNLLLGDPEINRIYVYHPDHNRLQKSGVQSLSSKVEATSDRSKLFGLDAVFITSPSRTHVEYIRSLIDDTAYLYCEKPPAVTREELAYLSSLEESRRRRLYFGFNYRFSELAIIAKDFIESGQIGSPTHCHFVSTQGMAYRESFNNNWRSNAESQLSGIFGNVSIHYIDLCMWLLGDATSVKVEKANWSGSSKAPDSVHTTMRFRCGCSASIFTSYAAPFINQAQLIFTDGFIKLDNGALTLYAPRDSYDADGRFTRPAARELLNAKSSRQYYDQSLVKSLKYFISVVAEKGRFTAKDFDQALRSNAVIFDY